MAQTGAADLASDFGKDIDAKGNTTFAKLLTEHARNRPDSSAIREKNLGVWQTWTWSRLNDEALALAGAFSAKGLKRGQNIALIGENRPRLYAAMLAAQMLGAIPVPMYQDAIADEMVYVFESAEIEIAVVEDQEQVDKMLEIAERWPALKVIIYDDTRGLRNYDSSLIVSHEAFVEQGERFNQDNAGFVSAEIDKGQPDDNAAMFYTSGTTGRAKGVIHTHRNLITVSRVASEMEGLNAEDEILAYLPVAWIGQNIFSYTQWLINGYTVNCPESSDTVSNDMREIGPTYYFAPPRVLEALLTQVTIRMEDAAPFKRNLYEYFMRVAREVGGRLLDGDRSVGMVDRIKYKLGNVLFYGPLRNALGMSRVRVAYTAGEAIGPDLFVFFRSLGINLKQLYGSTETAVFVCVQPDGQVKADTVGPAVAGVTVKIADDGEVMIHSPGLLKEYYKNPEATAEVRDAEGWFHTGDAGFFDADGHVKIIDRAKDVGKLSNGSMFAPKYIENKLKFFPFIQEAVAFGNGKDQVMAMINIDFEACGNYAEKRNIPYAGYADLAAREEVYELIRDCVEQTNLDLAKDDMMASSQVHRFLILHKELDADDGELTRTRKVRRRFIGEKYEAPIAALYEGKDRCFIETEIKFEDGRVGRVSADLRISEAKTIDVQQVEKAA